MKTKTEYRYFSNACDLCLWIDEMYAKYGKQIINLSTSVNETNISIYFMGFITILQSQEQINID